MSVEAGGTHCIAGPVLTSKMKGQIRFYCQTAIKSVRAIR